MDRRVQSDPFDRTRGVGFGGKLCQKMRKDIEKSLQGKRPDEAEYKVQFTEYMVKCQMINGKQSKWHEMPTQMGICPMTLNDN